MNVLVVEPNQQLGMLYKAALERSGYTVTHAVSAQTAVQAVDQNLPQLIILELQLTGHSGVEFLYELRSYPEWQTIPVLVNSLINFLGRSVQVERLQHMGVERILYKPETTLRGLLRAVGECGLTTSGR